MLKIDKYKVIPVSFSKHHIMRAYGKEVTYEHLCVFETLALDESEQSVSCFSTVLLGAISLICTGYARWMLEPDLTNTGKEKTLTVAWHQVHNLVFY
jgi:hypothetical protein